MKHFKCPTKEIFNFTDLGFKCEVSPDSLAIAPLIKMAIEKGLTITRLFKEGYSDTAWEEGNKKFGELGTKLYEDIDSSSETNIYQFEDAMVWFGKASQKYLTLWAVSGNNEVNEYCKELSKNLIKNQTKKGYVFAICSDASGKLNLSRLGYCGMSLEKENYTENNIRDMEYVLADLKSKTPSGKLFIASGAPGTGKTSVIKSILMDLPNAMFVIVPPGMVRSLGSPELLPVLASTKESYGKQGSIILILEDADELLAPRMSDNIASISSILNMSDGILGSLFDIRIIATTNAKYKQLDEAVVRDMRLSKHIHFEEMDYERANKRFQNIIMNKEKSLPKPNLEQRNGMKPNNEKKTFSLAEVYKAAFNEGWRPKENAENESAFSDPEDDDDLNYL